jgi:polyisoprenoid-binding protein YceI
MVRTGRRGAIAKVGHDLLIEVGTWAATVEIGAELALSMLELTADSASLRVVEGTGGIQALGEDERAGINQTIVDEVLKGTPITFRSRSVEPADDGVLHVEGDLELMNGTHAIGFDLTLDDDGHVLATAVVTQTAWGIKPYTTLFGTLKVADDVQVAVEGTLSRV